MIHDVDSLNWTSYQYVQEGARIPALIPDGGLSTSVYPYTRASYLSAIESASGDRVEFDYEDRSYSPTFIGGNVYEFFQTKQISKITARSSSGDVVDQLLFDIRHLSLCYLPKPCLYSIFRLASDGSDAMALFGFQYQSSSSLPGFGLITGITYHSGGRKQLHYSALSEEKVVTTLDVEVVTDGNDPLEVFCNNNIFVSHEHELSTDPDNWYLGIWDGYWDIDTVVASGIGLDQPAVSSEGWVAIPNHTGNVINVYRWMGGYWKHTSIANPCVRYGDGHMSLFPGPDCFLLITGSMEDGEKTHRRSHFFAWDGETWHGWPITETDHDFKLGGLDIDRGVFGMILHKQESVYDPPDNIDEIRYHRNVFGQFNARDDAFDLAIEVISWSHATVESAVWDHIHSAPIVAAKNWIAWMHPRSLQLRTWDVQSGTWIVDSLPDGRYSKSLIELPNGVAWNRSRDYDGAYSQILTVVPGGSGFRAKTTSLAGTGWDAGFVAASNHTLAAYYPHKDSSIRVYEWDGRDWSQAGYVDGEEAHLANRQLDLYATSYVYGPRALNPHYFYEPQLRARRFRGTLAGGWEATNQIVELFGGAYSSYASTDRFFVCHTPDDSVTLYVYDSLHLGSEEYKPFKVAAARISGATGSREWFSTCGNTFVRYSKQEFGGYPAHYLTAYAVVDTVATGKARPYVIDTVKFFSNPNDSDAITVTYDYFAATVNPGGDVAKVARAEVSAPFYLSEGAPVSYSRHYFYNDLEDTRLSPSWYAQEPLLPTDLTVGFGLSFGGYHLDGHEYLRYSFDASDSTSRMQDSVRTDWSLHCTSDTLYGVFWPQATRIRAWSDSLLTQREFEYNPRNGLPTVVTEKQPPAWYKWIDSTFYAYESVTGMEADNALSQPLYSKRILDATTYPFGEVHCLSRSGAEYIRHGSWKSLRSYTYRNFEEDSTIFYSLDMLPSGLSFDAYGHLIASKDLNGNISCAKVSSDGVRTVASATGAHPQELLVQTFEEGVFWDGWTASVSDYANVRGPGFTGDFCFRMEDDPSLTYDNLGPQREIPGSALTAKRYYFSVWARTSSPAAIRCLCLDASDAILSGSPEFFIMSAPDSLEWYRVDGLFDISAVDQQVLAKVRVQLILPDGSGFAEFDDFRFHPISAVVTTRTYDERTGLLVTESGNDNTPVRYSYDVFNRLATVRDEAGNLRSCITYESRIGPRYFSGLGMLDRPSYKREVTFLPDGDSVQVYTFYDGLGRPIQTRLDQGHYSALVSGSEYDAQGRIVKTYKSYVDVDCRTADTTYEGDWGELLLNSDWGCLDSMDVDTFVFTVDSNHILEYTFELQSSGLGEYCVLKQRNPDSWSEPWIVIDSLASQESDPRRDTALSQYELLTLSGSTYFGDEFFESDTFMVIVDNSVCKLFNVGPSYCMATLSTGDTTIHPVPCAFDFDDHASFLSEISAYYDTDGPGVDCGGRPFAERHFARTSDARLEWSAIPGAEFAPATGRVTGYQQETHKAMGSIISTVVDRDSITSCTERKRFDLTTTTRQPYRLGNGAYDTVVTLTYPDAKGRPCRVVQRSARESAVTLSESTYDDLGREVELYKKDYGTIRMVYDKAGQLRLMQNDKRQAESTFVYFKYDRMGRKVEEGLYPQYASGGDNFVQSRADDMQWPPGDDTLKVISYRWHYDYYADSTDTLVSPGNLVRVQNASGTYYKHFYTFPDDDSSLTITRLPIAGGSLKAVKRVYDADGSLKQMVLYPFYPSTTGHRVIDYQYDETGRVKSIDRGVLAGRPLSSLSYVQYTYAPEGKLASMLLGVYDDGFGSAQTVQKVDYRYNAAGWLTGINSPLDVVDSDTGGVNPTNECDHFGMELVYHSGDSGYYNGRLYQASTTNSKSNGLVSHLYEFGYNDLSWLTQAVLLSDTTENEAFSYDFLGHRQLVATGTGDSTFYTYDTTAGSSRLKWLTGMGSYQMHYDQLGNLIADTSRELYELRYDYRNLMTYARVAPNVSGGGQNTLSFAYDQAGQRILKQHNFQYWDTCGGGGIPVDLAGGMIASGGMRAGIKTTNSGGGDLCLYNGSSQTVYWYDGGVLLATFDQHDRVIDVFINTPSGRIAAYRWNEDERLYYFLNDQLGSPRVIMHCEPGTTPVVAQYLNYRPFGALLESSGSYPTDFQFTGKEHDENSSFDFHYFGARYYDARTGMFTSIDKAGQFASGYVYGGNYPVLGVDPDGNLFWLIPVVTGVVGGIGNVVSHWDNIGNVWQGLGYFGVGAAQGAISCFNPAAGVLAGTIGGGLNAALDGADLNGILSGAGLGGASSLAGYGGGKLVGPLIDKLGNLPPALSGMLGGAAGGAAGGFAAGTATGLLTGQNLSDALTTGLNSIASGAAFGAATGLGTSAAAAHHQGVSPWTGKPYETPEAPPAPAEQFPQRTPQENRAKGLAGEDQTIHEIEAAGGRLLKRNITIEYDGVRSVIDMAVELPNGTRILIEVKTGPTADLTSNQGFVIPKANEGGYVIPRGANAGAAGFESNVATQIRIIVVYRDKY